MRGLLSFDRSAEVLGSSAAAGLAVRAADAGWRWLAAMVARTRRGRASQPRTPGCHPAFPSPDGTLLHPSLSPSPSPPPSIIISEAVISPAPQSSHLVLFVPRSAPFSPDPCSNELIGEPEHSPALQPDPRQHTRRRLFFPYSMSATRWTLSSFLFL